MNSPQTIIKVMIVLFTIKPLIDLSWNQAIFSLAGRPFSLLHVTGVLVFFYFGSYMLANPRIRAPYGNIFLLFIIINCISILTTMFIEGVSPVQVIDLMLRISISYIIFNVAYIIAQQNLTDNTKNLLQSISIGTFIVLALNFVVIKMGYGGIFLASNNTLREHGLYYDPGVLSYIAMYNVIFTSYLMHVLPKKTVIWSLYSVITICMSMYLIYLGVSRSVFLLMAVFVLIYIVIFKQGMGKAIPVLFISIVLFLGSAIGLNSDIFKQRFSSELAVLDASQEIETKKDKSVDLGRFERLGSNRGQVIAYALDEIIKRPPLQLFIGNFNISRSHSDYIDVFSRNGIIGIVVYVMLIMLIWARTLRLLGTSGKYNYWPMCVLAFTLMTLYILYSIPFRPLSYTTMSWFMWSTIGYAFGRHKYMADSGSLDNTLQEDTDVANQSQRRILSYKSESNASRESG